MPSSARVQNVMEIGLSTLSNSCLHNSKTQCTKSLGKKLKGEERKPLLSKRVLVFLGSSITTLCFHLPWEMFLTLTICPIDSLRWNAMLKDSRTTSDLLVGWHELVTYPSLFLIPISHCQLMEGKSSNLRKRVRTCRSRIQGFWHAGRFIVLWLIPKKHN